MANKKKRQEKPVKKKDSGKNHQANSAGATRQEDKLRPGVSFRAFKRDLKPRKTPALPTPSKTQSGGWFPPVTPASLANEANPPLDHSDWIDMFSRIDKANGHAQHRSGNGSSTGDKEDLHMMPAPSFFTVFSSLSYQDPAGGVDHVSNFASFSSTSRAGVPQEHTPPMQSSSGAGAPHTEGRVAIPGSSRAAAASASRHDFQRRSTTYSSGSPLIYPEAPASTATTLGEVGTNPVFPSMIDNYRTNLPMAYQYPSSTHGMTMHPAWQNGQYEVPWYHQRPDAVRNSREQDHLYAYPPTFNHAYSDSVIMTSAYQHTVTQASNVGVVDSIEYERLANQYVDMPPQMSAPVPSYLRSSSDTVIDPGEDRRAIYHPSTPGYHCLPGWKN